MLRNEMRISKKGGNNEREHLCDGGEDDEQSKERESLFQSILWSDDYRGLTFRGVCR